MGTITVADTVRNISRQHLEENNGLLLGQSISAVGWVNNTVPDCTGIVELPMTDVAGAGIAVGTAMVGRRPIFVIRFQDFLILNGSPLIFYAAKSKELHGKSTPIFVRAIAADGIGPVHSGVVHSIFMHFPGFRVCSPMTPKEYEAIWADFMAHDDPMIVSEHRASYANTEELEDIIRPDASITLYPISATRFAAVKAALQLAEEGIICNVVHILWLKPFVADGRLTQPLVHTRRGLVIDAGHEISGASQSIAYQLTQATAIPVKALGLEDHTKCLCPPLKNEIPTPKRIAETIRTILRTELDSHD
ncbi:MAG: transketolase C-terminal domain-containing protein [Desulfuromonadales bacterium]